jgi:hypothetical protein
MKLIIVAIVASATFKINDTIAERAENKDIPAMPALPFNTTCAEKIIVYEPSYVCTGNISLQQRTTSPAAAIACASSQHTWLKI